MWTSSAAPRAALLVAVGCSAGDAGADAAAPSWRVELPAVEQAAATESVRCLVARVPEDLGSIVGIRSTGYPIVHDLAVLLVPASRAPDGTFGEDCDGGEDSVMIHETRLAEDATTMPAGFALDPGTGTSLLVRAHYLNVTDGPVAAGVVVWVDGAAATDDRVPLGAVHAVDGEVPAPPGTSAATVACRTAPGSQVALVTGVGGSLAASVRVRDGATTLATAVDASHPGTTLWPEPFAIRTGLEASCDYLNPTGVEAVDRCGLGALVTGARGLSGCGP